MILFRESGNENIECAKATCAQFFVERLDADADERRECTVLTSLGSFSRSRSCVTVFFLIGSIAVAVFEVDAKVFNRLALKFLRHSAVDCVGQPRSLLLFARPLGVVVQK